MKDVEVEIRSFISKNKYEYMLEFFKEKGKFINEDEQVTYYFDCDEDLRIQKNNFFSKIWLKKGKIHDDFRKEIEIKFGKDHFDNLASLFSTLGYNIKVKWFRKRHTFEWQGIDVAVDYTRGYGYILELEKKVGEEEKRKTLEYLKDKLKELEIELTPKEEFNNKYEHYLKNWEKLIFKE